MGTGIASFGDDASIVAAGPGCILSGMKSTALALACCTCLAAPAQDIWAGGKGGGGRSSAGASRSGGSHASGAHHHHHAHTGTAVFISSPGYFYPYPPPWYYPPPAYSLPEPPPVYIEQSTPPDAYWFYCPASGAYYPYVNECAGGWQLVVPQATIQPSSPG